MPAISEIALFCIPPFEFTSSMYDICHAQLVLHHKVHFCKNNASFCNSSVDFDSPVVFMTAKLLCKRGLCQICKFFDLHNLDFLASLMTCMKTILKTMLLNRMLVKYL